MPIEKTVDIIVRTKDRALFLRRALRSITAQTVQGRRPLIINDGGEPAAVRQVVDDFRAELPNIEVYDNPVSVGRAEALNIGLANSSGDYIAIHDDDDSWNPHFLAAMILNLESAAARHPTVAGAASHLTRIFERVEHGKIVRERLEHASSESRSSGFVNVAKYLIQSEDLLPIQIVLRRAAMLEVGRFDPAFDVHEDREFLIRFLDKFDIIAFPRRLAFHHVRTAPSDASHANSMTDHDLFRSNMTLLENRLARGQMSLAHIDLMARHIALSRDASAARFHAWQAEIALDKLTKRK